MFLENKTKIKELEHMPVSPVFLRLRQEDHEFLSKKNILGLGHFTIYLLMPNIACQKEYFCFI